MPKALPKKLHQDMAKSVLGSGPSLIPPAPAPKNGKEEEIVASIDELISDSEDRDTIRKLVAHHLQVNGEKKKLEKDVDILSSRIKALIGQYGIEKANCDGATINYFKTSRSTIDATKLLAAGVEQETITLCTDVTPSMTLKITSAT